MNRVEQIRRARQHVEKICGLLERPEDGALERCETDLTKLIGCLEQLESARGGVPNPNTAEGWAFAAEVLKLRRGVSKAQVLLDAAGRFYAGWARLVALRTEEDPPGGYSSSGAEVVPIDRGTVVMHG